MYNSENHLKIIHSKSNIKPKVQFNIKEYRMRTYNQKHRLKRH